MDNVIYLAFLYGRYCFYNRKNIEDMNLESFLLRTDIDLMNMQLKIETQIKLLNIISQLTIS